MTASGKDTNGTSATPPATVSRRAELAARWRAAARERLGRQQRAARRAARKSARAARQLEPRRQGDPGPVLAWSAAIALGLIALLVIASTAVSLAESYRGLYDWAATHGFGHGLWAEAFPLMVDVFVVVGELAAFVSLVLAWRTRSRIFAWALTVLGLAASVTGNVAHLPPGAPLSWRVGAGVPPLAAATALFVGLGVLKRLIDMEDRFSIRGRRPVLVTEPEPVPSRPVPSRPPRARRAAATAPFHPGPAAEDDALAELWRLAGAGQPIPSMRQLARDRFAAPDSPEGNKRAAGRVLARFHAGQRPVALTVQPPLNNHQPHREMEPAR
jgi:hypothetical protein